MKLIIAGSRTLDIDDRAIRGAISLHGLDDVPVSEIISGGCPKGVDLAAQRYADVWYTCYKEFRADWAKHGTAAGPIRNKAMAAYGDALLLIWDGKSRGSASMRKEALLKGLPIYEVLLNVINKNQ